MPRNIKQKLRLLNTYEHRRAKGEKSEVIVPGLATRTGVSTRTLQRYIKEARDWRNILPKLSELIQTWIMQLEVGMPSPDRILEKLVEGARDFFMEPWARGAVYSDELIQSILRLRAEGTGRVCCQVEQEPLFRQLFRQLPDRLRSDYRRWGKQGFDYAFTCKDIFLEMLDQAATALEKVGCSPITQIAFAKTVFEDIIQPSFYGYAIKPMDNRYGLKFGRVLIAQANSADQLERCQTLHTNVRQSYREKFNPTELYNRLEESKLSILGQLKRAWEGY